MSTPTPEILPYATPEGIKQYVPLEAYDQLRAAVAEMRAENRALVKLIRRLHSAIVARMSASEPTIEERLELRHAWEQAGKVLDNAATLPVTPNAAVCGPKVALDEAIARMEAVPVEELMSSLYEIETSQDEAEQIRTRLIAAARGQA